MSVKSVSENTTTSTVHSKIIPELIKASPDLVKLYHIARVLEEELDIDDDFKEVLGMSETSSQKKTFEKDVAKLGEYEDEEENEIKGMKAFTEFPKLLKKQFLLPDQIFDQRLLRRELLIQVPVRREQRQSWNDFFDDACKDGEQKKLKRQRTYILLDCSASTVSKDRLELEKAIALLHLGSHQKGQGEVFFRAFNEKPGPLVISKSPKEFEELIQYSLLPLEANGQTNLQIALAQAMEDITHEPQNDPWEILIISDGLCEIDVNEVLKENNDVCIHMVLIGDENELYSESELRDLFNKEYPTYQEQLDLCHTSKERSSLLNKIEKRFQGEKHKLPLKIQKEHITKLKELCEVTKGLWLRCRDLNSEQLSEKGQLKSLEQQLKDLYAALDNKQLTPIERDELLKQLITLQSKMEELKQLSQTSDLEEINKLNEGLDYFLSERHDLQDLILEHNLKIKWSQPEGEGEIRSIWPILLGMLKQAILKRLKGF